jgi:hypothetical protein
MKGLWLAFDDNKVSNKVFGGALIVSFISVYGF